jgi:hypothetical protein
MKQDHEAPPRGGTTVSATGHTARPSARASSLTENTPRPAAMRGLTEEQRQRKARLGHEPSVHRPRACRVRGRADHALHCEAGSAAPPREAIRAVDNVRTTRPDLLPGYTQR